MFPHYQKYHNPAMTGSRQKSKKVVYSLYPTIIPNIMPDQSQQQTPPQDMPATANPTEVVNQFLEAILQKVGLFQAEADSELKAAYLQKMRGLLEERIGLAYINALHKKDPNLVQEMEKLGEKRDLNAVSEFLASELPEYQKIAEEAMLEFGANLLKDIKQ